MSQMQKVAIITGASQGIGAGLVKGFLGRGYRVVANSRKISAETFGTSDVLAIAGDISDPQVAKRVVQSAVDRFGRATSSSSALAAQRFPNPRNSH